MFTQLMLVAVLSPAQPPASAPLPTVPSFAAPQTPATSPSPVADEKPADKKDDKADDKKEEPYKTPAALEGGLFPRRLARQYYDTFFGGQNPNWDTEPGPSRGSDAVFSQPPFALSQHLGPAIGQPVDTTVYPLTKALYGGPGGDWLKDNRIKAYGWVDVGGNYSSSKQSNTPVAYAIVPNRLELDQLIFRVERPLDTVQQDHWDYGFRATNLFGIDYRYTTAQGYFSQQLLKHNRLNGYDPLELYGEVYVPGIMEGLTIRAGRFISPPDIEAQLAPDNFLYTHSLLFTYDAYTHSGFIASVRLNEQWTVQAGLYAGSDIAPWTNAAIPTLNAAIRWVSPSKNDSVYLVANGLNDAAFRAAGGHDNLNYIVMCYTHKFTEAINTYFETYYLWQYDALKGGTVNDGPPQAFGGGGGAGPLIPGLSDAYGVLNYTNFRLNKTNNVTVRNEWWCDAQGQRTGYATNYSSHTLGLQHHFNELMTIRPEIGYFRAYDAPAFDNGRRYNQVMVSCDLIVRF